MALLPQVVRRQLLNSAFRSVRARASAGTRCMCTAKETDLDKPVKFSTSKASTWKAEYSRKGAQTEEELWYELPVILGSVSSFLIYFLVLREENDIDETLKVPIYDRIEGLEELQLQQTLEYNLDKGLPIADIQERLAVLRKAKAAG
ncbi:Hypothetical protein NTJ_08035 [Nesidiocoris tenuis]|uniref:Uncharacterized protein n=1 Tax=Nesidiocoris tenuis TaxID=355587 RepID=A0ABN7ASP6_9HEMI|nr:Hypothetical protein NTJ_08035 [Nesidiocoris tenuis]